MLLCPVRQGKFLEIFPRILSWSLSWNRRENHHGVTRMRKSAAHPPAPQSALRETTKRGEEVSNSIQMDIFLQINQTLILPSVVKVKPTRCKTWSRWWHRHYEWTPKTSWKARGAARPCCPSSNWTGSTETRWCFMGKAETEIATSISVTSAQVRFIKLVLIKTELFTQWLVWSGNSCVR